MATITGVFIDPEAKVAEQRTIEKSLQSYYNLLGCRCIDITQRDIGGKVFDIIVDDEAGLVDKPVISGVSYNYDPMLLGKLFITKGSSDEVMSLDEGEIQRVLDNIIVVYQYREQKATVAVLCGYCA